MRRVVLNPVAAAMLAAAVLALPAMMLGAEGSFDRSLHVTGPVDLDVSTGSGHIHVRAGSSGTVEVHAVIKANDHWGGRSAEERVREIEANPPVEQDGNTVRVGHIHDSSLAHNLSISYDLVVPQETRLHADTGSGDQSIDGIEGPLRVSTGSGRVSASHIGSEVHASSGSGNIEVDSVAGSLAANTGSGSIRATGISGDFSGETGSGDVRLEQSSVTRAKASTGSGSIELQGVRGPLHADTGSGHIVAQGEVGGDWHLGSGSGGVTVDVPDGSAFDLHAHTDSGKISTKLPITIQGAVSRNDYQGKAGAGGYLLEVKTGSGDIRIE